MKQYPSRIPGTRNQVPYRGVPGTGASQQRLNTTGEVSKTKILLLHHMYVKANQQQTHLLEAPFPLLVLTKTSKAPPASPTLDNRSLC